MANNWEAELDRLRVSSQPSASEQARLMQEHQAWEAAVQAGTTALNAFMYNKGSAAQELLARALTGRDRDYKGVEFGPKYTGYPAGLRPLNCFMLTSAGLQLVFLSAGGVRYSATAREAVEAYGRTVNGDLDAIRNIVSYIEQELTRIASQAK